MPKIITNEFDKTKAGISQYTNFTVVVPGLVHDGQWTDKAGKKHNYGYDENDKEVFDKNGIYECSSKSAFEKYIGKVAADSVIIVEARAPERAPWSLIENTSTTEGSTEPKQLTEEEFNKAVEAQGNTFYLCSVTNNTTGQIGYLKDSSFIYAMDDRYFSNEKLYALIYVNQVGQNEQKGAQYGNQIAYELLKMGYTILYKKLDKTKVEDLTKSDYWEPLKDKATYDFRYIVNGLLSGNKDANNAIIELAHYINVKEGVTPETNGRGDCTALVDLDASSYKEKTLSKALPSMISSLNGITASKYAAILAPYVVYGNIEESEDYDKNTTLPAHFHYLACAARAAEVFNEWYAIAGYTRGISNYSVIETGIKLGEAAIDIFEPRFAKGGVTKAVNLIVKMRNSYVLWGNRTAEVLEEEGDLRASHFLNIRQLCSTIKKQVYVACRRFTFDPNSDILWGNFCNAIRPTLEKMKADQGIKDYKFIKVATEQKAILKAKIRIVPIEAVEDFDISLYLEDSLSNVMADIEEE